MKRLEVQSSIVHVLSQLPRQAGRALIWLYRHTLSARRLLLPPSTDLLGLWRRSDCTVRTLGRRMDDAGAATPLSSLRHIRNRPGAFGFAEPRALVPAVALWSLARRQRTAIGDRHAHGRRAGTCSRTSRCCDAPAGRKQRCAGKPASTVTTLVRSICS